MDTLLAVICLGSLLLVPVLVLAAVVQALRKKPIKRLLLGAAGGAFVAAVAAGLGGRLSERDEREAANIEFGGFVAEGDRKMSSGAYQDAFQAYSKALDVGHIAATSDAQQKQFDAAVMSGNAKFYSKRLAQELGRLPRAALRRLVDDSPLLPALSRDSRVQGALAPALISTAKDLLAQATDALAESKKAGARRDWTAVMTNLERIPPGLRDEEVSKLRIQAEMELSKQEAATAHPESQFRWWEVIDQRCAAIQDAPNEIRGAKLADEAWALLANQTNDGIRGRLARIEATAGVDEISIDVAVGTVTLVSPNHLPSGPELNQGVIWRSDKLHKQLSEMREGQCVVVTGRILKESFANASGLCEVRSSRAQRDNRFYFKFTKILACG